MTDTVLKTKGLLLHIHQSNTFFRRSGSRDSDRKPYRKEYDRRDRNDRDDRRDRNDRWDNKEKYRDSYRDNRDSSKTGSKFKNEGMAGANLPKMNWDQSGLIPFQKEFYAVRTTNYRNLTTIGKPHC